MAWLVTWFADQTSEVFETSEVYGGVLRYRGARTGTGSGASRKVSLGVRASPYHPFGWSGEGKVIGRGPGRMSATGWFSESVDLFRALDRIVNACRRMAVLQG